MSNDNSFSPIGTFNLPEKAVDYIEKQCIKVPWFFFKDCAYGNEAEKKGLPMNPYFSHTFLDVNGTASTTFSSMPWNEIGSFIGIANNIMLRAHVTLQYPRPESYGIPHNAHVDNDKPHLVGLYYVNDSDGDTFFFNNDADEIVHREPAERGKIILFDGKWKHSSSSPSKNIRMTLNINYEPTSRTSNSKSM